MTTNYSIKSGDTLWNICKNHYKLTNNADIAKKVQEVAKANNIDKPDLIFAGDTLKLGSADTVETGNKATNPIQTAAQNTPQLSQAQKAANVRIQNVNLKTYEDLNKLANSSVSIFGTDIKTEQQKNAAYLEYSQHLLNNYYDTNKDGKVTVEEFAAVEQKAAFTALNLQGQKVDNDAIVQLEQDPEMLELYDENKDGQISQEEYTQGLNKAGLTPINNEEFNNTIAQRSGNLFAKNLDMNNDGTISKEEMAFFNKNADEIDGKLDGVITNAGESGMFEAVTGANARDKEINRVVNKYLSGETLTAEEQKILEKSTNILRTNMAKAAGINVEG